jgi:hypothetical protein
MKDMSSEEPQPTTEPQTQPTTEPAAEATNPPPASTEEAQPAPAPASSSAEDNVTVPLNFFRDGDVMAEPAEHSFSFNPANPEGLLNSVAGWVRTHFGLAAESTVTLFATIDFEKTALQTDSAVASFLLSREGSKVQEVFFTAAAPTSSDKTVKIAVTSKAVTAHLEYRYSVDTPNLRQNLLDRLKAAIEEASNGDCPPLSGNDCIEVVFNGETSVPTNDRFVVELLNAQVEEHPNEELAIIVKNADPMAQSSSLTRPQTVSVEATYKTSLTATNAAFKFVFVPDQPNLLEAFKQELRGELELPAETKVTIALALAGVEGEAVVVSDRQLLEVLSGALEANATVNATVTEESTVATLTVDIVCSTPGVDEEGQFTFKTRLTDEAILTNLKMEVESALDLEAAAFQLSYIDEDGEAMAVTADRQLRDILLFHKEENKPARFRADVQQKSGGKATENGQSAGDQSASASDDSVTITFSVICGEQQGHVSSKLPKAPKGEALKAFLHDLRLDFELLGKGIEGKPPGIRAIELHVDGEKYTIAGEEDSNDTFAVIFKTTEKEIPVKVFLESAASAPSLWLRASVVARVGEKRETADFAFRCAPAQQGALQAFINELRNELELEDDAEVSLCDGADEPPTAIDSDQKLLALATKDAFHPPHRFTADIRLPSTAPVSVATASRLAELNALVTEWRDALEGSWRPSDIEQMANTFRMDNVPLPVEDPLLLKLRDAVKEDTPRPIDELHSTLESWTAHFEEEVFSAFSHHCREMLDFVVEFSPVARLKRAIGLAWRHMSVGLRVRKEDLINVLKDSRAIAVDDINECFNSYKDSLTQDDFFESMNWLFRDTPQDIVDVLTTLQQGNSSRSPNRARREVELLRRKRLQSEIKHAFDSVSTYHMKDFAVANRETGEEDWQHLALATAILLDEQVGRDRDGKGSWAWLISQCEEEVKAFNFISQLSQTQRSFASVESLSLAVAYLLSPGLESAALLPASRLLSALSLWGLRVSQLTCHTLHINWPPAGAHIHQAPPTVPHHVGSPIKVQPPAEERSSALVVRHGRYEYKHRAISQDFAGVELAPPKRGEPQGKTLRELMEEQKKQQPAEEKPKEEEKQEEDPTKQQSEQDSAAVRIQCAFRQRVARDEVRERKEGKSPASAEESPSRAEQQ